MAPPDPPGDYHFDAVYRGVRVLGTARADRDQITLIPAPGHVLEIPRGVFMELVCRLIVAAHTRP